MTVLVNGQPQMRKGTDEQSELEQQPHVSHTDQAAWQAEPGWQGAREADEMTDESTPVPPDTVPEAPPSAPPVEPIPVLDEPTTPPAPKPPRKPRAAKAKAPKKAGKKQ